MTTLNAGQLATAEAFFEFLFNDEKELIISGAGGVGKTFLMSHLIDTILPNYQNTCKMLGMPIQYSDVVMTATTNKAAEVLAVATKRPTQTIHSFLGLRVQDNFSTGESTIAKTKKWKIHTDLIIFLDEASMTDRKLLTITRESTLNCKLIYVGDHCQLTPVKETVSPVFSQRLSMHVLTEPMRNSGQPALMALCNQFRNTVETGQFSPITLTPGVIDLVDLTELQAEIDKAFIDADTDAKILAYTNNRVNDYNDYIRELRGLTDTYTVGEHLVNNSAVDMGRDKKMLSVEERVTITKLSEYTNFIDIAPDVQLEVRYATLTNDFLTTYTDVPLPENKEHYQALIKHYQKVKNWVTYFKLKNEFPDLRPCDACTVHKSQGSTYDTVFIDLDNIGSCHNQDQVARMLYVAISRARNRIFLFGKLPTKYGG